MIRKLVWVIVLAVLFSSMARGQEIAVDPAILTFGDVIVGNDSLQPLVISNNGASDLIVSSLGIIGSDANQFELVNPPVLPFIVSVGGPPQVLQLRFSPVNTGNKTALLQITSNDPNRQTVNVLMEGIGVEANIDPNTRMLDYGSLHVGDTLSATVQLGNSGDSDLVVDSLIFTGANASEFALNRAIILPDTVAPGGAPISFSVNFLPLTAGPKSAAIQIYSNDPDENPLIITLNGTGIVPEIAISPDSIGFGQVAVFTDSIASVQISNNGTENLIITDLDMIGVNATLFSVINPPPLPATVTPGGTPLTVNIQFIPRTTGLKNAFFVVTSNDPNNNPLDIPLTGEGVFPDINVNPPALDFGDVTVGGDSSRLVNITNTGLGTLTVTAVNLLGPDAQQFRISSLPPLPLEIRPGASPRSVGVAFSPDSVGVKTAFLSLISNDPDENPLFISLDGNAIMPDIAVEPEQLSFGNVAVGSSASLPLTIRNDGDAALVITDTVFAAPNGSEYSLTDLPFLPYTIPVNGDSLIVTVRFRPAQAGPRPSTLQIFNNDADENPFEVPLTGFGIEPDISVLPNPLNFGGVVVGETLVLPLTIFNEGGVVLTVTDTAIVGQNLNNFRIATMPALPFNVNPNGGAVQIMVEFLPDSTGFNLATLQLFSNDPDENPFNASLFGSGVEPRIRVAPDTMDFAGVRVGQDSLLALQIFNFGSANLIVSDTSLTGSGAAQFSVFQMPALPFTVPFGDLPTLVVLRFMPDTVADYQAAFRIFSNDPNMPVTEVPLLGSGVVPELTLISDSLDFGGVVVNEDALGLFPIVNSGGAALRIESAEIRGPDSLLFRFSGDDDFPFSIAAGDTGALQIRFSPDTLGLKTAELIIRSDDENNAEVTAALLGSGVLPAISLDSDSIDFGFVNLEVDSLARFAIRSIGSAPLTVSELSLSGINPEDFLLTNIDSLPLVIPADTGIFMLEVNFSPLAVGPRSAVLSIKSNDPDNQQLQVTLSGRAVNAPQINNLDISEIVLGQPATFTVTTSADTSIRRVRLKYADNSQPDFNEILELFPIQTDQYSGVIAGGNITSAGLKVVVEVTDNYPTSIRDTMYLQVNIPEDALVHTFEAALLNQWQMFTLPFVAVDSGGADINKVLEDLGQESGFTWRIFRTDSDGASANYFDLAGLRNAGDYGRFLPGNAFWLYLRDDEGGSVQTTAATLPALQTLPGDGHTIAVQPGWNQIGSPYDFRMNWNQVVGPQKDSLKVYNWSGTIWEGPLAKTGWTPLINRNFFMDARKGYAVFNPTTQAINISFMPSIEDTVSTSLGKQRLTDAWQMNLQVSHGENFDINILGMDPRAADGLERLDYPEPATFRGSYVSLYFQQESRSGKQRRLATDFRAPNGQGAMWYFTVTSSRNFVTLSIADLAGRLPEGFEVELYDAKYRTRHLLRQDEPITLRNIVDSEEDRFVLFVGTPDYINRQSGEVEALIPTEYRLLSNYPNPFNPETNLRFEMPRRGAVKLAIYNTLGQLVNTLVDETLEEGYYELRWDGRGAGGNQVASGLYFVRLQVNGFSLTGKMLKVK